MKTSLLTRPTLARQDAPYPEQGRSSATDPRFTFHASRFTVPGSEARMPLAAFFSILPRAAPTKNPIAQAPWGLARETRYTKRLSLVGLPQRGGLTFLGHQLSGGADCLHSNGIMLGRVADDHAELTTFTAVNEYFGHHPGLIEVEAIGLGTIHDAQPASLLGHAFFVDDLRYIIHASWFLLSR